MPRLSTIGQATPTANWRMLNGTKRLVDGSLIVKIVGQQSAEPIR